MVEDEGIETEEAPEPYLKNTWGPLQVGHIRPTELDKNVNSYFTIENAERGHYVLVPNVSEGSLLLINIIKRGLEIYFKHFDGNT